MTPAEHTRSRLAPLATGMQQAAAASSSSIDL